jgi:acyl-CoA reductase-like NAD-dependent aldehyde dehydrogenase
MSISVSQFPSKYNMLTSNRYIKAGQDEGATVITGGKRKGNEGYFIEPTIFADVKDDMSIMQEEIFGPVCSIAKFKNKEDAIRLGNNTTYGLAAAVHTSNLNTAIEVSNALKAGTVWVNTYNTLHWQLPFGGFKASVSFPQTPITLNQMLTFTLRVSVVSLVRLLWTTTSRPRPSASDLAMPCSVNRHACVLMM